VAPHDVAVEALRADLGAQGLHLSRERLAAKLAALAAGKRFEEAAAHRDAFSDLVRVVDRAHRLGSLREAGRVHLETADGAIRLRDGRLDDGNDEEAEGAADVGLALASTGLGERQAVAAGLDRASGVRMVSSDRPLAYPWPRAEPLERIDIP
jgi:hypothetical protein